METPSTIANTTFKVVKKGYDPEEVRAYLREVALTVQASQDHATSVEQRARAAVGKAQEAAQAAQAQAQAAVAQQPAAPSRDADTEVISRTLLLAQKTADDTIRSADREAADTRAAAQREADALLASARSTMTEATESARAEARRAGDAERFKVEAELQQLLARLEFLRDDVTQMEAHSAHHRDRLLQVADDLQNIANRSSAGLGETRRPVLSAAADLEPGSVTATDVSSVAPPTPPAVSGPEAHRSEVHGSEVVETPADDVTAPIEAPEQPAPVAPLAPAPAAVQLGLTDAPPRHLDDTAEVPVTE